MASFRTGVVARVIDSDHGHVKLTVTLDDGRAVPASAFPRMTGPLRDGDRVVVNTTGIDLGLGTGGVAFVLWNLDGDGSVDLGRGHIVKMRYTPWQTEVLAAEAPESPHHDALRDVTSIAGLPVVACSLHSQIAGVAAGVKAVRPDASVGYLMTDGAALPLAWSELVAQLKREGLVDVTATYGHAFGGDYEAVNVYSGLAILKEVARVDVAVVAMGPGVVGTATALGFTGMEQGHVLDAAGALGGRAIACLRMGWADDRPRHRGVSHHALTALTIGTQRRCRVVVPVLAPDRALEIRRQLEERGIFDAHDVVIAAGDDGIGLLRRRGIAPSSMGRSFEDSIELFASAAAAGAVAAAG